MSKILVSMDDALLAKLDAEAARLGVPRSQLLSELADARLAGRADRVAARRAEHAAVRLRELGIRAGTPGDATSFIRGARDER